MNLNKIKALQRNSESIDGNRKGPFQESEQAFLRGNKVR